MITLTIDGKQVIAREIDHAVAFFEYVFTAFQNSLDQLHGFVIFDFLHQTLL